MSRRPNPALGGVSFGKGIAATTGAAVMVEVTGGSTAGWRIGGSGDCCAGPLMTRGGASDVAGVLGRDVGGVRPWMASAMREGAGDGDGPLETGTRVEAGAFGQADRF